LLGDGIQTSPTSEGACGFSDLRFSDLHVRHTLGMMDYRRNRVPGGTYFFTVNLLERKGRLLVEHIDLLRDAFRFMQGRNPECVPES
jgi:hypothetical protein